MAFDEALAERVRSVLYGRTGVAEKRMFGGVTFLLRGKMFCGIVGADLMVRVGPHAYDECLAMADVRPMDFTGRPMKGYVFVGPAACRTAKTVQRWVDRSLDFVGTGLTETPQKTRRQTSTEKTDLASSRGAAKIAVRTPNVPSYTGHVDAAKYEAMRALVFKVIPAKAPGITQSEMMAALKKVAPPTTFPGTTFMWWGKCVQLDLEARGFLAREPTKPLRWHRKKG